MVRVLIAERDMETAQRTSASLAEDPRLCVVGLATSSPQTVRLAMRLHPDVIAIASRLSDGAGSAAVAQVMTRCPLPIVVMCAQESPEAVADGFRSLTAGALAITACPEAGPSAVAELRRTLRTMSEVKVVRRWGASAATAAPLNGGLRRVLVGASTGGPDALRLMLAALARPFPLPLVIVQHMAAGFTGGLVRWLQDASGFNVVTAAHDQPLRADVAYIVPEGVHATLSDSDSLVLAPGRPEHGMMPSASHLFRSVPPAECARTAAVLLTGMGKDGAQELRVLKDHGAVTIVQDRASAAVYGMPGEAIRLDAARHVLDPAGIGRLLNGLVRHAPPAG
ncbi:MAG TPA: chemotaxis protein CheB [Telluria sp.]|nr:chemotaxis protein CheB [Telluria sp.]